MRMNANVVNGRSIDHLIDYIIVTLYPEGIIL